MSISYKIYDGNLRFSNESGLDKHTIWNTEKKQGLHPNYLSQSGQDKYIHETFFKDKTEGIFVEIGGYNGVEGSNCYFFEKILNWSGLIIEPSSKLIDKISRTRNANVIHAAVSDFDGSSEFIEITSGFKQMSGLIKYYSPKILEQVRSNPHHKEKIIKVPVMKLESILNSHNIKHIDYCSIDVEGAECSILNNFDFDNYNISVLSIENNQRRLDESPVKVLLEAAGYKLHAIIGVDEIYSREKMEAR